MPAYITFDKAVGISRYHRVFIKITIIDHCFQLYASRFDSFERQYGVIYRTKTPVGDKHER